MNLIITENQYKRLFEETLPGEAPNFDGGTNKSIPTDQVGITAKTTDTDGAEKDLSTTADTDKIARTMNLRNNFWTTRR